MRSRPFHNIHDVKQLTEKAFAEISEECVWNCYSHVEKQEEYYRKLSNLPPIPAQNIESLEITNNLAAYEQSEEHFLSDFLYQDTLQPESEGVPIMIEATPVPQEIAPSYDCSMCDFTSSNIKFLQRHMKTHYQCDQCEKTFSGNQGKRNYERHLQKHDEPAIKKPKKSHKCDQCSKAFEYASYLKRHIEKDHKRIDLLELPEDIVRENVEKKDSKRKKNHIVRKLF